MRPAYLPLLGRLLWIAAALFLATLACDGPRTVMAPATEVVAPETLPLPATQTIPELATAAPSPTPQPPTPIPLTDTPLPSPTPQALRFAVIGDYGEGNQAEADVAALVKSWQPDLIVTTGDNNYPNGAYETIDENIGKHYAEYIAPYLGAYGSGSQTNRFYPTLGNHDWTTDWAKPYLDYFTLPGNERYYDFVVEPVHFFMLDSDSREPDGVGRSTPQAQWLKDGLSRSTSIWNLVVMHHPPYSSGIHGPVDWMVWPFGEWGADAVLAGHDHVYERLQVDTLYFINGLGGGPIYDFGATMPGSQIRYNDDYGAMLVVVDAAQITFQFITRSGQVIDTYQLVR
jgi:hypothetical protein